MSKPRTLGFTLIELLTVIAIIAILVGITAAVLPGVLERSKITRTEADFAQVRTALVAYMTDYSSYPPGYGYFYSTGIPNYEPYMSKIKLFNVNGVYDENWTDTYDLNGNEVIDLLEFDPVGLPQGPNGYFFPTTLYMGTNDADPNIQPQLQRMQRETRPFAYFPVNKAQADRFARFWMADPNNIDRLYARVMPDAAFFNSMRFPPAVYDAYVLISPGPSDDDGGLIPANIKPAKDPVFNEFWTLSGLPANIQPHAYYINALRTYYLATRDLNRNRVPDFDFRARTRQGEAKPVAGYPDNVLPDGTNGAGPLIFSGS